MAVDISTRYISDEDADRVYAAHPEMGRSSSDYCPTCDKKGVYRWKGADYPCDCQQQLQLHKHYLAAGIGVSYQRLDWDDLEDTDIRDKVIEWVANPDFLKRGQGLILNGDLGTGKTLAATLCLKQFVRDGHSCFATIFSEMIELYTAGWHSDDDRSYFNRKVVSSRVLLLDDIGRERRNESKLSETTFDNILRTRVQHGRSTIITTNMTLDELGEGYGGNVLSLLREKSLNIEVGGQDWRKRAREREQIERAKGEMRPIL